MRKRGGSYLFLPASKALLLGILVYSSKAGAHASGVSRARWGPLHARASRLGDRHLIWETDISSHTSRWCASRALQMDTDVSRMRGLNATNS